MSTNELQEAISGLQKTFKEHPEKAIVDYHSESSLVDGFRSDVKLRQHRLIVDEPKAIGGKDEGASPVELILAALATCQEISYKAYATALNIPLEKVSVKLTGTLDLKGFLGIDQSVRPGFQNIQGTVDIQSSADSKTIENLKTIVDKHCPVLDILNKGVSVQLELADKEKEKKIA